MNVKTVLALPQEDQVEWFIVNEPKFSPSDYIGLYEIMHHIPGPLLEVLEDSLEQMQELIKIPQYIPLYKEVLVRCEEIKHREVDNSDSTAEFK